MFIFDFIEPDKSEQIHGLLQDCRFCSQPFVVCRSCFRGQRYCGATCKQAGYRRRRGADRRRYDQTPKGRRSHRNRSRRHRRQMEEEPSPLGRVTHLSSIAAPVCVIPESAAGLTSKIRQASGGVKTDSSFCALCGRAVHQTWGSRHEFYLAKRFC